MNDRFFIISLIIILFVNIPFVMANLYDDFYFYNEDGISISQVKVIGWPCIPKTDSTCSNVDLGKPMWGSQPLYSGSNNFLRVEYPADSQRGYHIWYIYTNNYRTNKHIGQMSDYSGSLYQWHVYNPYTLIKKDSCKANFTYIATSCAEQGLPLSILTDTNLDVTTASAFTPTGFYWPSELEAWREVNTQMKLDIKKQGLSSSITGYPVTDLYDIYAGTSYDFSFIWQTSKNTDPGNYEITLTSTVPDTKCDQTNDIPVIKTQTVYIAQSLDTCRTDVQNFRISSSIALNQPITFSGEKLTVFQDWEHTGINCEIQGNLAGGEVGEFLQTKLTVTLKVTVNCSCQNICVRCTLKGGAERVSVLNLFPHLLENNHEPKLHQTPLRLRRIRPSAAAHYRYFREERIRNRDLLFHRWIRLAFLQRI